MKNYFAKPAAALALLLTLLLGACDSPINPRPRVDVPVDKGVVRVETGAGAARTAVPAVSFARYEYWFAKGGDAAVKQDAVSGVFELEEGSYTVTVKAFVAAEDTSPATQGTSASFTIAAGSDAGTITVALAPVVEDGEGTLSFALTFPGTAEATAFTLTRVGGTESFDLLTAGTEAGADPKTFAGTQATIGAGYWLARAFLQKGGVYVGKSEVAHIYDNMTTALAWTFAEENFAAIPVVSAADDGPGTLREALTRANAGLGGKVFIDLPEGGKVITLATPLPPVAASLVIEGNGATLTQNGFTPAADIQLLNIGDAGAVVSIRRLHFTGGRGMSYGGAIRNNGNLTLESCIFSNNQATYFGGAIYTSGGLSVNGCTFYNNSAGIRGGAIYRDGTTTIVISLAGNMFFGNTANYGKVVGVSSGTGVTSNGYNVSDKAAGVNENTGSGYVPADGDLPNVALSITPVNFKPLFDSDALNRLPGILPGDYPAVDFYGAAISPGGASGAVQTPTATGYYLDYGVASGTGAVTPNPPPNAEGLYAYNDTVTLTASCVSPWGLRSWTVDGTSSGNNATLNITMDAHKTVRAAFAQDLTVNNEAGLRAALGNQTDGDVITFGADIALTAVLPAISKGIIIEGNGHILTQTEPFSGSNSDNSSLLPISGGTVTIRRLHFKDGRATSLAGAINVGGNLTLESCVFSGNTGGTGGAISLFTGAIVVRGCTFYNNSASNSGGAIYCSSSARPISLTGNLFFKNTAANGGNVVSGGAVTSYGYNVSDKTDGADNNAGSGYTFKAGLGDVGNVTFPITPANYKLLEGSLALGRLPTPLPNDYPTKDFYGATIPENGTGASGAVQGTVVGYYLDYGVAFGAGAIAISPNPDENDLYSSTNVTLTATHAANFTLSWTIDGVDGGNNNTLTVAMNAHKTVRATFKPDLTVSDEAGLRDALNWQEDGNVITFSADITLAAVLPTITKSITIEGNGHILTRSFTGGASTNLLRINSSSATVTIRRLHFKDGRSTNYGGAIRNNGNLTLESCIFSGNEASTTYGGAIHTTTGSLTVQGCTFYNNKVLGTGANAYGGAIFRAGGTVVLTGNLFFGNTAGNGGNVGYGASITSLGYNVSDKESGAITATSATNKATASGYADSGTGDVFSVTDIAFATNGDPTTKPSSSALGAGGLQILTGSLPALFPTTYFDGTDRDLPATAGAVSAD